MDERGENYSFFTRHPTLVTAHIGERNLRRNTLGRRMSASVKAVIVAALFAAWSAGCSAPTESGARAGPREIIRAREQLSDYAAECTARHGYDPESASGLGAHALGNGEREWRECIYGGIEKILMPKTLTPEPYRTAITEDRKMTESIAEGKMTRAQRRERVQEIVAEIDRIEEANRVNIQTQAIDRTMKQEIQRQLDVTRRNMIMPLGR